jgi:hypothetical protein
MSNVRGGNTRDSCAAIMLVSCPSSRLVLDLINPYLTLKSMYLIQQQATAKPTS